MTQRFRTRQTTKQCTEIVCVSRQCHVTSKANNKSPAFTTEHAAFVLPAAIVFFTTPELQGQIQIAKHEIKSNRK